MSAATLNSAPWDARTLAGWSEPHLANVESALSRWVGVDAPVLLGDAMRYAVLDGGKRLRPLLVLAASEAVGGNAAAALRAACATELIHAYSLVHDDLPCMDNDVLRRGKPTVHVKFGEPMPCWPATPCRPWPSSCSPPRAMKFPPPPRPCCAACSRGPRAARAWLAARPSTWPASASP